MSEIADGNKLDGLVKKQAAGRKSLPSLTDGNETPSMTLAVLNSALQTLVGADRARIVGKIQTRSGRVGTMILFYEVEPADTATIKEIKK